MKPMTVTSLREKIYSTIDQVVDTGIPVELERKGKKIKIVLADKVDKFANLKPNNVIVGDPDELVDNHPYEWQEQKNL